MRIATTLIFLGITGVAQAQPTDASVADFCPNFYEVGAGYPPAAAVRNIASGDVVVSFALTADDHLTNIVATEATHPVFAEEAIRTVRKLRCKSGGEERQFRVPFSYRLDLSTTYVATPDDIPSDRLAEVVPQIAELRATPQRFTLRVGEGVKIDTVKVLAYDGTGKPLGRLRQFDRGAQPKQILAMRGAGIVQAIAPGAGFLELTIPAQSLSEKTVQRPVVRIEITVSE